MKRTLTINLGGIVFHIDEDAYLLLNQYLETLKNHFIRQEGSQDILNDIESRIAEILNDKRSETKQVINLDDVNQVIAIMGQPPKLTAKRSRKRTRMHPAVKKGKNGFSGTPMKRSLPAYARESLLTVTLTLFGCDCYS